MEQMEAVEQTQEQKIMEEQRMEQTQVVAQEQVMAQETKEETTQADAVMETISNGNETSAITEDEKISTAVKYDNYAELVETNGYVLNMHVISNAKSKRSKGCKFYLTKKGSNIPLITGEDEIGISCRKLLQASDHKVMDVIRDLDVGFTEDDLMEAFEKAKDCVVGSVARMDEPCSMTVDEAYTALMQDAVAMAEEELQQMEQEQQSETETAKVKTRDFKYDKEHQTIIVSKKRFRQMLEDMDCGFTATTFCKKLAILEGHMGISILQRNNGRCGYDYATADMGRVYKFKIVDLYHLAGK